MKCYLIILLGILHQHAVHCYESGSAEANKIETKSPIYETIIFGDVADILSELENMNSPLEAIISGSESDENMEDLLTEYQRFLDKAHKQKMEYLEKNKGNIKNKVPLIRHETYMKNNPGQGVKYDNIYYNSGYYNPNIHPSTFGSPLDIFLPTSQKVSSPLDIFLPPSQKVASPLDIFLPPIQKSANPLDLYLPATQKVSFVKKDIPRLSPTQDEEMTSYIKHKNDFPLVAHQQRPEQLKPTAKKSCMMSHDAMNPMSTLPNVLNSEYMNDQNTLNVRIKVDIQMPKLLDNLVKSNNRSREEDGDSKETTLSVPFPYLNFPIPMNLLGYKKSLAPKYNKHDLGHHKKKKFRMSNNNKKHKKNMRLPWFNMNASQLLEPLSFRISPHYEETFNFHEMFKKDNDSYQRAYPNETILVYAEKKESRLNETDVIFRKNESKMEDAYNNETISTEKTINVLVNKSSIAGNITEDNHKDNSVETDYTTVNSNIILNKEKPKGSRKRRDISTEKSISNFTTVTSASTTVPVDIVPKKEELITNSTSITNSTAVTAVPVDTTPNNDKTNSSRADKTNSSRAKRDVSTLEPLTTSTTIITMTTTVPVEILPNKEKSANSTTVTTMAIATTVPVDSISNNTSRAKRDISSLEPITNSTVVTTMATTVPVDVSNKEQPITTLEPITNPTTVINIPTTVLVDPIQNKEKPNTQRAKRDTSTFKRITNSATVVVPVATTVPVDISNKEQTITTLEPIVNSSTVNVMPTTVPVDLVNRADDVAGSSSANHQNETTHNLESVKNMKKTEKMLSVDKDLTYWPDSARNRTALALVPHDITTIIVERENQKAKLNMTNETIRNNHTTVLEKAIFGDVNWDDVDTVAPVFMSFVGKYINGVLTFCSQNVCHSMKCGKQACVHRICQPEERWNQRGHCDGSNNTDSVASMQSIMDLPSNVGFEIVDILQHKMLGKMYGSIALCITTKCVSFVTSKRNFLKSKCSVKELNSAGLCPIPKKSKLT